MRLQKNHVVFAGFVFKHNVNNRYYCIVLPKDDKKLEEVYDDEQTALNRLIEIMGGWKWEKTN